MANFIPHSTKQMEPRPGAPYATTYTKITAKQRDLLQRHVDDIILELCEASVNQKCAAMERPLKGFPRSGAQPNYSALDIVADSNANWLQAKTYQVACWVVGIDCLLNGPRCALNLCNPILNPPTHSGSSMREGDRYPELRNMNVDRVTMQERVEPIPDWSLDRDQMMERWRADTVRVQAIEGVRITMPRDDFEAVMSIYQAHYHACTQNPAVREAWHQYKMLVALTAK